MAARPPCPGSALFEPGFAAKSALQEAEKEAIVDAAVALVEPGTAIGDLGRDDDLRPGPAAGRRGRADRGDQLGPGCRRAPRRRPAGPDDHPDRRRPDPIRRPRRAVRGGGPAQRPRRPGVHGRPRHGRPLGLHLAQPDGGRDEPGPDRGRRPAGRRGRPHEVGPGGPQLDRSASTRPTS